MADGGIEDGMTAGHEPGSAAGASPPADPFDPVALEARLAAARLRRNSALAGRPAGSDARPPAPADVAAAPPHPTPASLARLRALVAGRPAAALAGVAAGFLLALLLDAALPFAEPSPAAATVAPSPAERAAAPAAVAPAEPLAVAAVGAPAVLGPAERVLRPEPRRAAGDLPRVSGSATRSARNAPRPITPPQAVGLIVRDLNAATVGRTAAALGVRERVALPGVPLAVTLDRRGLRLRERAVRGRR